MFISRKRFEREIEKAVRAREDELYLNRRLCEHDEIYMRLKSQLDILQTRVYNLEHPDNPLPIQTTEDPFVAL